MAVSKKIHSHLKRIPVWGIMYWVIASLFMFFVFSNRQYDIKMRISLSIFLLIISFLNARVTNKILIPKFYFKGKQKLFLYLLFFLLVLSLWLISIALIIITLYSSIALPNTILPSLEDVIILLSGTYLISLLFSVFFFTKKSYQSNKEKFDIEKQKDMLELNLKEVQLQILKEQIHPHFIFNMMNNLYALVNVDSALSREVIVRLSDLLDYMLYECNTDRVELSDEIKFINNYTELERIRHDDSLHVETEFPNHMTGIKIAPLVLFPFVENAFKHGLKQTSKDFIYMRLEITSLKIQFTVKNSFQEILPSGAYAEKSKGVGLKNVQERLDLLYPKKHKLQISTDNNTFDVNLIILR